MFCCRPGQTAEICLSPINMSRVILEMGEQKHVVPDTKCPLLFPGFKQNTNTSRNFWNTILFKNASTFFESIRFVEIIEIDGPMIGQKDDGRTD